MAATVARNTVEIITIGNEILIGQTLDTNSNWIARQVTRRGWNLQRVTQIRDTLHAISDEVREALRREPTVLLTVGGLGPTHDDMTLKGVAQALGRPLVLNRQALDAIRRHYEEVEGPLNLTGPRRKMATLPQGAKTLPNPVGTAPGVVIKSGRTKMFCLPGVPSEMKKISKQSIIPMLKEVRFSSARETYMLVAGIIESALAPVLSHAQRKFPGLYFKSHPRGQETGKTAVILLHLYRTDPASTDKIPDATAHIVFALSKLPRRHGPHREPSRTG